MMAIGSVLVTGMGLVIAYYSEQLIFWNLLEDVGGFVKGISKGILAGLKNMKELSEVGRSFDN